MANSTLAFLILMEYFCEDIDECLSNDYCKFGTCENTPGNFRCVCPEGFDLSENRRHCIGKSFGIDHTLCPDTL